MGRSPAFDCEPGLRWKGSWSSLVNYYVGDAVTRGSASYICVQSHTDQEPPNTSFWNLLAEGQTISVAKQHYLASM